MKENNVFETTRKRLHKIAKTPLAHSIVDRFIDFCKEQENGIVGMGLLTAVIGVVVTIVVLANAIPVLWPIATTASANVTAMTGTDAGTTTMVAFWPIALLLVGLGIAVAVIVYALKMFGLFG